MFKFKTQVKDKKSKARAGEYETPHGKIQTPCFVPVGTKATVKGLTPLDLKEIGVQILFANTYHLHLRPGEDLVKEFGGVSKFMVWNGPTMTDSGGFQVFSLAKETRGKVLLEHDSHNKEEIADLVKITEDGVKFRSHIDGTLHEFTPEISIGIQKKLGADFILCFDECAPHPSTEKYTEEAMIRTHEWAIRSLRASKSKINPPTGGQKSKTDSEDYFWEQGIYGIVQGGVYKELREKSSEFISSLDFDAIAIGGVSVGESKKQMRDVIDWVSPFLPEDKTRHLLGIGEIDDIFDGVERGMDTFDCVIPTRFGRYGIAFVGPNEQEEKDHFRIDLMKSLYAKDKRPIAKDCKCYACKDFTRAYIHHLFRSHELLAYRLVSYHNLWFVVNLVKDIRSAILEERFLEMKKEWMG